jgi:hypothetical protein
LNPKFLAIVAVLGFAIYYIFGNKVAGSTVFTGSTAQPTPLSTAGGIGSLENLFPSIFGAATPTAAQTASVQSNATAGGFTTNTASVNSVAGGATTLSGVNTLEGSVENEQSLLNSGYITTTDPTLSTTLEPLAPMTNTSAGLVPATASSLDSSTSLDSSGFDYSGLSSLG